MKSPAEYISNKRRSQDKPSWKDQLAPRIKALGGFKSRRSKQADTKSPEQEEFTIVHFPDRPARAATKEEIPTEEECRIFLMRLRDQEREREREREREKQSHDYNAVKSSDEDIDPALLGFRVRVPEVRRRTGDPSDAIASRTYSPQPFIGEAREVKLKKIDTTNIERNAIAYPRSAPCMSSEAQSRAAERNWATEKTLTRLGHDELALRAHPVHIIPDSGSQSQCRQSHAGKVEWPGYCQSYQQEGLGRFEETKQARKPRYSNRAPHAISTSIPVSLNHNVVHRATSSSGSHPETASSVQSSPHVLSIATALSPAPPLTPLSDLSTPRILARLEGQVKEPEQDLYEEEWAGYYFDEDNFQEVTDDTGRADSFMSRELSLEEYDEAFASPTQPGARWI